MSVEIGFHLLALLLQLFVALQNSLLYLEGRDLGVHSFEDCVVCLGLLDQAV